jgi:hypothetical protein
MSDEYVEEAYKPQTEEEKRKERIANAQEFFNKQAAKKTKAAAEKKIPGTGFTSAIGNTPVVGSADIGAVDVGCVGDMCAMFGGIKLKSKSKKKRKMKRKSSKRRKTIKRRTNKRRK